MAYTALEKMKKHLQAKFVWVEMGPASPSEVLISSNGRVDFNTAVRHFIHERCTNLRFDAQIERQEKLTGVLMGKSTRKGQIPYNMQMDIDRLCFARAIERFLESGSREDAFDVYFCYIEIFGSGYANSRRMIELLSEYESTASTMLMSHRDHYSHSVYVFLLGLAMYDSIVSVRDEYKKFYKINDDQKAAHHFLQFWGMTALFHDIGYPFEISFEQVKSYFAQSRFGNCNTKTIGSTPFVCFGNMNAYLKIDDCAKARLKEWYNKDFGTIEEWLTYDIANVLARSNCNRIMKMTSQEIMNILKKEARPSKHKEFIDHAYFSAVILFKELFAVLDNESTHNLIKREHLDSLTAIALHNSLYKRKLSRDKSLKLDDHAFMIGWHPLAYLLQLTDEIQCWDRMSYGRNTRTELHPMTCHLSFDDKSIYAEYVFDKAESNKIADYLAKYEEYKGSAEPMNKPKLKSFSNIAQDDAFAKEIGLIVGLSNYGKCNGSIKLEVTQKVEDADWHNKHIYLSSSNFVHIYEFAAALNAQYNKTFIPGQTILDDFDMLSLEYKLSNIGQAKFFARALDEIGCFYTDRPVAYEMVTSFSDTELKCLGAFEHKRWENEKQSMCWMSGKNMTRELKENGNELREQARMHYDLDVQFADLNDEEKAKDTNHLNVMMEKLLAFDGIRIYRYKQQP